MKTEQVYTRTELDAIMEKHIEKNGEILRQELLKKKSKDTVYV